MDKEVVIKVPPSCQLSIKQREQRDAYIADKEAEKAKMWAWIDEVLKEQSTIKTTILEKEK
jgi:hypothetical protein